MMGRTLLILGVLGTAGLIAAAVLGYRSAGGETAMRAHVLVSLASTLVLMFAHTWIVLYLLATGQVMSRMVRERGYDVELLERARRLRLRALPWLVGALVAVIATFLLGGAAFSGVWLARLHQALFYVALVLQAAALKFEQRVLAGHDGLGVELARRMEADAAA